MTKVQLLEPAQHELDDAINWYASQSPGLEKSFLKEILKGLGLTH